MTERSSYRYSRLSFFNEASIKKLKQLCRREFSQALRAAQQQNRKWSAEVKTRLEKAMEADEFADMLQNPNREFEWDFYERLGLFRDFLKTLSTSSLYDNYEKAFLSEIYSSIPKGDLNKELSYDQVLPYTLSEEERKELLGKLTARLVENGLDASWLNELPLRNIYVRNTPLKFFKDKSYLEIPRALYVDGAIHYNIGKRPHGEESYAIDSKEGMAILLHELRHCWQSQNPEWTERHQNKDISIETDAFLKQFEFQKALDLQIPSYSGLMHFFDFVSPTEAAFDIKSKRLWRGNGYGCPDRNYTFPGQKHLDPKEKICNEKNTLR